MSRYIPLSRIAGYGLALWVQNPMDAFVLFFLAVILVIVGTYLLVSAGSIALLNMLQSLISGFPYSPRLLTVSPLTVPGMSNSVYAMTQGPSATHVRISPCPCSPCMAVSCSWGSLSRSCL